MEGLIEGSRHLLNTSYVYFGAKSTEKSGSELEGIYPKVRKKLKIFVQASS